MMKVLCLLLLTVVLASAHPPMSEIVAVETGDECAPHVNLHIHWDRHARGKGKGHPEHADDHDDDHADDHDDEHDHDEDGHEHENAAVHEGHESGEEHGPGHHAESHHGHNGIHIHITSPPLEFLNVPEGTHYVYANCHLIAEGGSEISGNIAIRQAVPFGEIEFKLNATVGEHESHSHHVHIHEFGIGDPSQKCSSVGEMHTSEKYSGDVGTHSCDDHSQVHNSDQATLIGRYSTLGRSIVLIAHHEDGDENAEHESHAIQACCTIIRACESTWEGRAHGHH